MGKSRESIEAGLKLSLAWCDVNALVPPLDLLIECARELKTVNYFTRVLRRLVSGLYDGTLSKDDFIDSQAGLVEQQLRRAWNEGMRSNGLDPATDMTPEYEQEYQEIVAQEWTYIDGFAQAVNEAATGQTGKDALYSRVDLWANRYTDVKNRAQIITAEANQFYEWHYGDTVEHCADCSEQAGQVRTGAEWRELRARGIFPQSHDLECHGYNCQCEIRKARKPKST